jgi:phosphoglycolate phosphatase-like HAD superfamily hydrolase
MTRPRGLLFDVDGTLVDSNDLHAQAWQQAFRHFGIEVPIDEVRSQIGKGGDNLIPALLPPELAQPCQREIEDFRADLFKRDYLRRVRPFPGVRALFERLWEDGIGVVLASSAGKDELAHHIDLIGCCDLIAAATSKDDVERSKPDPDIFAAALVKLAPLSAADVFVVGDTPYDAQAAHKLGIKVIGFRSGGFAEEDLLAAGAEFILNDPEDMLRRYDMIFGTAADRARQPAELAGVLRL